MAADINPYSTDYAIKGCRHPYGENNSDALGSLQRGFSRTGTYLAMHVIPFYGLYYHAGQIISNRANKDVCAKHLSACLVEISKIAYIVSLIAVGFLLTGSTAPILKTIYVANFIFQMLFSSARATSTLVNHPDKRNVAIHGFKYIALDLGIALALRVIYKSIDAAIKPLAVIHLMFKAYYFVQFVSGPLPEKKGAT